MSYTYSYLESFAKDAYYQILRELFQDTVALIIRDQCFDREYSIVLSEIPVKLLLKVEKGDDSDNQIDFDTFIETIKVGLDIKCEGGDRIMYHMVNMDLLWRPETQSPKYYNYMQYINFNGDDSTSQAFHYLFKNHDYKWGDPFEFDSEEKQLRKTFYAYIKSRYLSAKDYLDNMNKRFFASPENFNRWEKIIDKKVFKDTKIDY